jgi:DNA (cytosine-5)-methyltransferase 1
MSAMAISFLSVCSGIEAASVAFAPLGWQAVGFSEIEAFPSAVLAHHYGSNMPGEPLCGNGVPNFGDFTTIDPASLPQVDILCGGTPCQAFSVAGKRMSLEDARGNLTLAFSVLAHELVRSNGLQGVLWENVPGVLSTTDNAFGCFLGALVGADDPVEPGPKPKRRKSNDFWSWRDGGRTAVTDDDGIETGEFIDAPEGHVTKWPSVGMVAGPRARLAWRVFDAQYFGLAQRRKRVFVVASFGDRIDPAAVLFERKGLHGDSPPRREEGQRASGTLSASTEGGGGLRTDFELGGGVIPILDGAKGRTDKRGLRDGCAIGKPGAPMFTLRKGSDHAIAHAFDARQSDVIQYGDMSGPLDTDGHTIAVAIQGNMIGRSDSAGPAGCGFDDGGAMFTLTKTDVHAVAFDMRGREGGAQFEGPHDTANIRAASGGSSRSYVAAPVFSLDTANLGDGGNIGWKPDEEATHTLDTSGAIAVADCRSPQWAVRRLTPLECEKLQGFPPGYTKIPWRGKPAEECPDGPRYKALGNSWAVPCVRWIAARIDAELRKR